MLRIRIKHLPVFQQPRVYTVEILHTVAIAEIQFIGPSLLNSTREVFIKSSAGFFVYRAGHSGLVVC